MDEQNANASSQKPPSSPPWPAPPPPFVRRRRDHSGIMGGVIMIVVGVLFLMHNFIPGFSFGDYWPVILIAIGGLLLWRARPEKADDGRPQ